MSERPPGPEAVGPPSGKPPTPPEAGAGADRGAGAPRAADGSPSDRPQSDRRESDRRQLDRRQLDRRSSQVPVPVERRSGDERRTGQRRTPRNINAYELGADELEFIQAIGTHKQRTGRAFPTWSEVLGILRALGYEKQRR